MKRILIGLLIGLALFEPWPVWAETLTLDQAIQTAIANNPQLKATQARLGVSEAETITAGTRLNPSFVTDNGIAEKTYRVGLEQTFELGGKRKRRVALAQAQRQVVLAEINTALLGLRADVRRAYTQLFNTQQREEAYRDILRTSEQLVDISKKRERAGDIATLDVLQTEIVSVNARNDLQSAAYQAIEARNRLSALLNQPLPSSTQLAPPTAFPQADLLKLPSPTPSDTITLQGSVQEATTNLENLIETALTRRPEVQELSQRLAVTQAQLSLAKANRIPNLTVAAGPDIVTGDEGAFNAFIVGNLELPVFNRQQGPLAEALARQQQLAQEQAALKNRITFEVINAHTAFVSNQERIKRFEAELLPKAEQVVQMSRRAFVEGKSSILTPINAQQAYINTRLGYLQALMDYQNAISDLERAVGTGL